MFWKLVILDSLHFHYFLKCEFENSTLQVCTFKSYIYCSDMHFSLNFFWLFYCFDGELNTKTDKTQETDRYVSDKMHIVLPLLSHISFTIDVV